jgi:hypothetical protein
MVSCDLCGASPAGPDAEADLDASPNGGSADAGADAAAEADEGTVPLSWMVSVEAGRIRTYCETCARQHLRSIEAKLDSEWW